jgi:hypothetical protein
VVVAVAVIVVVVVVEINKGVEMKRSRAEML